jgi:hypothetical protein
MKLQNIRLDKLKPNAGQIAELPRNPRFIRDEKFAKLVKSIEDDPEMLSLRELIVYPLNDEFVIICGNMRYRAMKQIGYKEAPCKVLTIETPVEKLRAYAIKDNCNFGGWDEDDLGSMWDEIELETWGYDIPAPIDSPPKSKCTCPECGKVHSKNEDSHVPPNEKQPAG